MTKEVRNNIQAVSAIGMLVFGCGLSIAGFCVEPVGSVSESVILIFAQSLIYAGSALGIDSYVNYKLNEIQKTKHEQV